MKLYVTRHGETQWNKDNRICGSTDIELNETGMLQARKLAGRLEDCSVGVIYASPMIRARQTAEIISQTLKVPIVTDPRLREINFGIYEGAQRGTEEFLEFKKQFAYTGAQNESRFRTAQRVYNFLDDLREAERERNVLVVCHGGICRFIYAYFHSMTNEEFQNYTHPNCGLVEFEL